METYNLPTDDQTKYSGAKPYELLFESFSHEALHGHIPALIFYTNNQGQLIYCGGQGLASFGYQQNSLAGHSVFSLLQNDPLIVDNLRKALNGKDSREIFHYRDRAYEICLRPIQGSDENIKGIAGMLYDVTEWFNVEMTLRERMRYDPLTGVGNRQMLREALAHSICLENEKPFALIKIGVNHLNDVDTLFGPSYSDSILKQVANRLRKVFQKPNNIARSHDNVFSVIVPGESQNEIISNTLVKIKNVFETPYYVDDNAIALESNMGIAFYPLHGMDVDTLIRRSTTALNIARAEDSKYKIFKKKNDYFCINNVIMLADLRSALENEELFLHYQPKIDMKTGMLVGLEALLRWEHPEKGLIPPSEFIPLAERTEIISRLTYWVADKALAQASEFNRIGLCVPVAINLSTRYFQNEDAADQIQKLLDKWQIEGRMLELEITETAVMKNPKKAIDICHKLRSLNAAIAIDDFGIGYSPLTYLKDLNVTHLKIDRSFINTLRESNINLAIVESIIQMAKKLGVHSVAEGIEDQTSFEILAQLGCDQAQGFYIAKPMSANELIDWENSRFSI